MPELITPDQYFSKWDNQGVNVDGKYGNQCMDNAQRYSIDVVGASLFHGNAIDQWANYDPRFYIRIPYSPGMVGQKGDIVLWNKGVGEFGHIGVLIEGSQGSFVSFDQNWPLQQTPAGIGTGVCHRQSHNYSSVQGFLRPIKLVANPNYMTSIQGPVELFTVKFETSQAVFVWGHFPTMESFNDTGHDWNKIHRLDAPRLVREKGKPEVFLMVHIDNFNMLDKMGITGDNVEEYASLNLAALNSPNETILSLQAQVKELQARIAKAKLELQ